MTWFHLGPLFSDKNSAVSNYPLILVTRTNDQNKIIAVVFTNRPDLLRNKKVLK